MTRHDTRYKDLFNHVHLVRALFDGILQACVGDGTAIPHGDELDWRNAQMLPTNFVTDDLKQRHGDCIWQLPYRNGRPVYVLLSLEHAESIEEFQKVVHTMRKGLRHPRYSELRRSVLSWVKAELWPRRVKSINIKHIQTLQELDTMLIEERPTFDEVPFRKGLEKGLEKGRLEGETLMLQRLIERRFGPVSDQTRARITAATSAQLEVWALNILDAKTLDDVFAD